MTDRGKETVEIFKSLIDSPSLEVVEGEWYLFEKKNYKSALIMDHVLADGTEMLDRYKERGWTVTPVVVTKVIASR